MHQNIAGLLNKSDVLTVHIQELLSKQINIDILCITEHFIMSGHEKLLNIPNYKLAACYSRNNIKRGGACILIKQGFEYQELPNIMRKSVTGILECCAIKLVEQNVIVLCAYRPPKLCNLSKFYESLDGILKEVCTKNGPKIILCGDFNINTMIRNRFTLEFECFLLSYNLKLEVNVPTRHNSNTCLDNFAHNFKQKCKWEVIDLAISDHTAQILKIKVNKSCRIKYWRKSVRDISDENLLKFKKHLNSLSFTEVYNIEDPNLAYDTFLDLFLLLYNSCFPLKYIRVKFGKKIKWVSKGIRVCSRRQRYLLWQTRIKPTAEIKQKFRDYS